MALYAFDPGAGHSNTIGYARFEDGGDLLDIGQLTFDGLVHFLEGQTPVAGDVVVYERYIIKPHKLQSHKGSRVETIQTIGAIRSWAIRHKLKVVEQADSILSIAQMWFQIKMPTDHAMSHQISATLHGMYYLHLQGIIPTELEKQYAQRKETP
jgi:hypothetical protein